MSIMGLIIAAATIFVILAGAGFYTFLAKVINRIKQATFINSYLSLSLAGIVIGSILRIYGAYTDAETMLEVINSLGLIGIIVLYLSILICIVVFVSKLVWQCSWTKAFLPMGVIVAIRLFIIQMVSGICAPFSMLNFEFDPSIRHLVGLCMLNQEDAA